MILRNSLAVGLCLVGMEFYGSGLWASEVISTSKPVEELNKEILALIEKLDGGRYTEPDKTFGFLYHYKSSWNNPFTYNIFIGKLGKNSNESLVRVESTKVGQERMWRQIIEAEILKTPPKESAREIEIKSHFYSQTLNLVSPAMSVYYNSRNSPSLTTRDTVMRMGAYFLSDLLLAGGLYLYADQKRHRNTEWENLIGKQEPTALNGPDAIGIFMALAVPRAIRMIGSIEDTTVHNRAVELKYVFRY